jgi:hypothetical protein
MKMGAFLLFGRCVIDACLATFEESPEDKVADRLLNHRDQKFRLSYVLGGWRKSDLEKPDDDEFSFESEEYAQLNDDEGLPHTERVTEQPVFLTIISPNRLRTDPSAANWRSLRKVGVALSPTNS